ncbi:hypothetical protein N2152v2_002520 [Parachlorella kessleri]
MEAVQRMQSGKAAEPGDDQVMVFPEPGFVVKTVDENGAKVFINVCGSPKLALPGGWADGKIPEEAKRHLEKATQSATLESDADKAQAANLLRFPLSMAAPRQDTDHRGEVCTVIDCILNAEILRHAGQYRPLKYFIVQLVMGWAQQKNGLQLDPQYKLPKMRYKGDAPPPQYIRPDAAQQAQQGQQQRKLIAEVDLPDDRPAFALRAAGSKRAAGRETAAGLIVPQAAAGGHPKGEQQAGQQERFQQVEASGPAIRGAQSTPASAGHAAGTATDTPARASVVAQTSLAQRAEQLQHSVEYLGRPAEAAQLTVHLPAQAAAQVQQSMPSTSAAGPVASPATPAAEPVAAGSLAGIAVHVAGHAVSVEVPGCQPLRAELPLAVTAQGASAKLALGGDKLVLRLPFRPFRDLLNELQQSAPHKFGSLGLTSGSLLELD